MMRTQLLLRRSVLAAALLLDVALESNCYQHLNHDAPGSST